MTAADPVVLAVAPTGARRTQADHPALPITPAEIAATAAACRAAGAAMLHLHARDDAGRHSLDPAVNRQALAAVREAVGEAVVIQLTTEAAGLYGPAAQQALVRELAPEAASIALRELLPEGDDEAEAATFFAWLAETGILPQYILYTAAEVERFHALRGRGVIPAGGSLLFVLGDKAGGRAAVPADLDPFLAAHPGPEPWMACAFGPHEHICLLAAAERGGHCRVGFENNLHLPDGSLAPDNAALVARLAAAVTALGRPPADAATARRLLAGR